MRKSLLAALLGLFCYSVASGQFLMDMIDTTKDIGKGMLGMYQKFGHLQFSGYIQPQYQFASSKGAGGNIYEGGQFAPNSSNRFKLRRGRLRFDYANFNKEGQPQYQFVFQFDGTDQGVFIRDFWGRIWENKWHLFAFTTGMFARPFGWEVNYSSADRESPERGRMSQTLMKAERDLGVMVSLEDRKTKTFFKNFRIDAGLFNGQGLATTPAVEYDSYKDFIGQLVLKSTKISSNLYLSGGVSLLEGKIAQPVQYRYYYSDAGGKPGMVADSSHAVGSGAPREYAGINAQLKWTHKWGNTEVRGEYWQGTQTATEGASETPPVGGPLPIYVRQFNGAFFYFIQDLGSPKNQFLLKYDWYDPNTDVKSQEIGVPGSHLTVADIAYRTWGFGLLHHFNEHVKLVMYYSLVHNESTQLAGYESDVSDNVFTARLQFRF
jgi:hypothetical protein